MFRRLCAVVAFLLVAVSASAQGLQMVPAWSNLNLSTYVIPASAVSGGGVTPIPLFGPQSCTAPAYSFTGATTNGWGGTSTSICGVIASVARTTLTSTSWTTTVPVLAADGSASAPSYSFASETGTGFYRSGTGQISTGQTNAILVKNGTTNKILLDPNLVSVSGIALASDYSLNWSSTTSAAGSADVSLSRGAADVLEQKRSTNAQAYRLYNTYTDASNYERLNVGWSSNLGIVTVGAAGTGLSRGLDIGTDTTSSGAVRILTGGTARWTFTGANGNLLAGTNVAFGLAAAAMINTAPTVTSAGTSPSVTASNGTAAFRVNVGTGGTATTIVMAMPTATTGWNCDAQNLTANAANRANQHVVQQSSTTTAVTVQNQTISTGAALAFTASDIVRFICVAY